MADSSLSHYSPPTPAAQLCTRGRPLGIVMAELKAVRQSLERGLLPAGRGVLGILGSGSAHGGSLYQSGCPASPSSAARLSRPGSTSLAGPASPSAARMSRAGSSSLTGPISAAAWGRDASSHRHAPGDGPQVGPLAQLAERSPWLSDSQVILAAASLEVMSPSARGRTLSRVGSKAEMASS